MGKGDNEMDLRQELAIKAALCLLAKFAPIAAPRFSHRMPVQ
jgi:hypothetical protein